MGLVAEEFVDLLKVGALRRADQNHRRAERGLQPLHVERTAATVESVGQIDKDQGWQAKGEDGRHE
jgi:hypothetical protein